MKYFLYLFLITLLPFTAINSVCYAQSKPLRATLNLLPPYSVFLSDYVAPGTNKLSVNIYLNDISQADLDVKLRFSISGDGVSMHTKPDFSPMPIRLTAGVLSLTSADIAPYFDASNLIFNGITQAQFIKNGRLPEGIYQFCVEVVEYRRGIRLSEKACAPAWIMLNNPPIWNTPTNEEIVKATNPQNILFNWTPRHTGSPNSAFTTEYEFTLVEIWPANRNPNDAIITQIPLLKTTTIGNSLIYGPSEQGLTPGRRYAARIRAYDKEGRDLFINNGYSEVLAFTFGEECKPPANLTLTTEGIQRIKATWTPTNGNTEFTLRYRPYEQNSFASWYEDNSLLPYGVINNLKSGTKYEISVSAKCGSLNSIYSFSDTITLPEKRDDIEFICYDNGKVDVINKGGLKAALNSGETLKVGDFDVIITEVTGSNGLFSGKGIVKIPFLDNVKIATNFSQIKVNEHNEVFEGRIALESSTMNAVDQQTKDKITESLKAIEYTYANIESYIEKSEKIIQEADKVLTEVKELPEESKEMIQKGKQLIVQGKEMINNANVEQGKELIEKGKKEIKNAINKAVNGVGNVASQVTTSLPSYDKLKEIVSSVLAKQKKSNDKNIEDKEKEVGSKNSEMHSSNSTIKTTRDAVIIPDEGDNEGSDFLIIVNATNPKNKRPISNQEEESIKASPGRKRSLENRNKLIIAAIELRKYYFIKTILEEYTPQEALDILIGDINKDLETMAKEIFDNLLKGKKLDSVEDYVKSYIEKKVEERLQKLNIK